jgi:hypothetical protein
MSILSDHPSTADDRSAAPPEAEMPLSRLSDAEVATRLGESGFAFTPVPGRARSDGWTPALQQRFVLALAATGSIGLALQMVGRGRTSLRKLRDRRESDSFKAACDAALREGQCRVVDSALEQARDGVFNVRVSPTGRVTVRRRIDYRLIEAVLGERGSLRRMQW